MLNKIVSNTSTPACCDFVDFAADNWHVQQLQQKCKNKGKLLTIVFFKLPFSSNQICHLCLRWLVGYRTVKRVYEMKIPLFVFIKWQNFKCIVVTWTDMLLPAVACHKSPTNVDYDTTNSNKPLRLFPTLYKYTTSVQ